MSCCIFRDSKETRDTTRRENNKRTTFELRRTKLFVLKTKNLRLIFRNFTHLSYFAILRAELMLYHVLSQLSTQCASTLKCKETLLFTIKFPKFCCFARNLNGYPCYFVICDLSSFWSKSPNFLDFSFRNLRFNIWLALHTVTIAILEIAVSEYPEGRRQSTGIFPRLQMGKR